MTVEQKAIDELAIETGRIYMEDDTVVNRGDLLTRILTAIGEISGGDGGTFDTTALETLIGEIQTSPTANTILGRLKALEDKELDTSALETLIGEIQVSPTANTILGRLKALEDKVPIGFLLAEQLDETDAVEGLLTFTDEVNYIDIFNTDATNIGVFTFNGITIKVPPSASIFTGIAGTPAATGTVTGATTYIVGRYV